MASSRGWGAPRVPLHPARAELCSSDWGRGLRWAGFATARPDQPGRCGAAAGRFCLAGGWPAGAAAAPAATTGATSVAKGCRPGPSGRAGVWCGWAWGGPDSGPAAVATAGCWAADPGSAGPAGGAPPLASHCCIAGSAPQSWLAMRASRAGSWSQGAVWPQGPGGHLRHQDAHHRREGQIDDHRPVELVASVHQVERPAAQVPRAQPFEQPEAAHQHAGEQHCQAQHHPVGGYLVQHGGREDADQGAGHQLADAAGGGEVVLVHQQHRHHQRQPRAPGLRPDQSRIPIVSVVASQMRRLLRQRGLSWGQAGAMGCRCSGLTRCCCWIAAAVAAESAGWDPGASAAIPSATGHRSRSRPPWR